MKARSPMETDERIVELYFERNEDAILETDRKYRPYLYTIAHNILNDRFDCEECLDDTYMSTWNSIPPKRPDILHAFLARITRNAATDRFRKNTAMKRVPSSNSSYWDNSNTPHPQDRNLNAIRIETTCEVNLSDIIP